MRLASIPTLRTFYNPFAGKLNSCLGTGKVPGLSRTQDVQSKTHDNHFLIDFSRKLTTEPFFLMYSTTFPFHHLALSFSATPVVN